MRVSTFLSFLATIALAAAAATTHPATQRPTTKPATTKPPPAGHPSAKPLAVKGEPDPIPRNTVLEVTAGLSATLTKLGVEHALVGGAGCVLLGSDRMPPDIDMVVSGKGNEVVPLQHRIASIDKRFHQVGSSIYYHGHNFRIQLLPTDNLMWPAPLKNAVSPLRPKGAPGPVQVIAPAAIFFSKARRVGERLTSTNPTVVKKRKSDVQAMSFLRGIIKPNDFQRIFHMYTADQQGRILKAVQAVCKQFKNEKFVDVARIIHPS